jgi:LDH2 family malate/lactate/ureidoglycolate dehydrogenase
MSGVIPTILVRPEALRDQARRILIAYGADPTEAALQADARLQGELRGHPGQGQGMRGISRYCEMLRTGGIVSPLDFEILVDTPALALVDGHKGFGQVIASRAMDLAIEKARVSGVGLVGVRHSNHLGITALHVMRATERRMLGICLTNAGPEMAPWGGVTPLIGTNPWGLGAPTGLGFPLVLDMALSMSGKGMVRWHQRAGLDIPPYWAYDRDGRETTDPEEAMEGPLVPMGMFKGAGLSIFTDVLCGVLTGAAFGSALYTQPDNHDVGHILIALDIERLLPYEQYLSRMHAFCDELKTSQLADGFDEILLPGELEHRRTVARLAKGIELDREVYDSLRALASDRGVPFVLSPDRTAREERL